MKIQTIHSRILILTVSAAVLMKRKMVKAETMEGQTFSGKQAAQVGLVTGLADSFNAALATF